METLSPCTAPDTPVVSGSTQPIARWGARAAVAEGTSASHQTASGDAHRPASPSSHGGEANTGQGCFLTAVASTRRPRRRPCENGVVAFVVRADPNPTASFCPVGLPPSTTPSGLRFAVSRLYLPLDPAVNGEACARKQRQLPRPTRADALLGAGLARRFVGWDSPARSRLVAQGQTPVAI
jgi:hypothetical protein